MQILLDDVSATLEWVITLEAVSWAQIPVVENGLVLSGAEVAETNIAGTSRGNKTQGGDSRHLPASLIHNLYRSHGFKTSGGSEGHGLG